MPNLRLLNLQCSKNAPLTFEHFQDFFRLLPQLEQSERSWSVTHRQIEENGYDLKAVNPNFQVYQDTRSLEELLKLMEERSRELQNNLHALSLYSKD
jgi:type I restriction enzyme M protein